ncbi:cysteine-rich and transmembrane domain-containing protein PCC1-like isoform X2 [Arabidopsis lyrata subsp. lyrata]|uniref:cysteine-rich and transmembrane domain-containing protein PCC1-like isoform X2 n=1 Tax=Arabidopsis lyrata subsp. lyrata TaxID=81972 RepID=UPI000A29DE24|nr:cysteine-rich and transmembrane domain-containing protein PCC1-like isoform X2 [Arabidopsis lyrata subsp. lyrata]|eukprot:XP_020886736.1 cysteine-rich and transmembrane domain-containing protein PCC1-like isoform X2 [Arabidopsis lyrata subsp. lyrata]
MDQYDHKYFSVQKPSQTSSGPYISPPPIGYPTRDKAVGDPPAAAVKTNSKGCCEVLYSRLWRMFHVLCIRIFRMMRLK